MRRYVFRLTLLSLAALAPGVAPADDKQIAQQIMQNLKAEKDAGSLKGFSIDLQVDDGTVWLSGRVANEDQKSRALGLAQRISGVKQVVDDLSISAPPARPAMASHPVGTGAPGIVMTPPPPMAVASPAMQASTMPPPSAAMPSNQAMGTPMVNPYAMARVPTPAVQSAPPANDMTPYAYEQTTESAEASAPATTSVVNVDAVPMAEPAPMRQLAAMPDSGRRAGSNSSVLGNISKTLMTAVHARQAEEPQLHAAASSVQPASSTGAPVGSGVDQAYNSSRRSVVQTAQPVANVPQSVATADSLQPLTAAPPQMAMMPMQVPYMVPVYAGSQMQVPMAMGPARVANYSQVPGAVPGGAPGGPVPMYLPGSGVGVAPARYDHPYMPGYAWPSYAACPNYAAVTYPKQYSPTAWPYIGPFYPYPQVPLGWRKVTLEWDDGWWFLDFKDRRTMYNH